MNKDLAKALINKGVLVKDTAIVAEYQANMLGGIQTTKLKDIFLFQEVREYNGEEIVVVYKPHKATLHAITFEDIEAIDGMDPVRLAGIYGIKEDGSDKKVKMDPITGLPVRRGRKPKKVKEMIDERKRQSG